MKIKNYSLFKFFKLSAIIATLMIAHVSLFVFLFCPSTRVAVDFMTTIAYKFLKSSPVM